MILVCRTHYSAHHTFGPEIFLRIERTPSSGGGPLDLHRGRFSAHDSVRMSYEVDKLWGEGTNSVVADVVFNLNLQLVHVIDLLHRILVAQPKYTLLSFNCWTYSAIILGALSVFGKWKKKPESSVVRSMVKFFGQSTAAPVNEVTQNFVDHWTDGAPLQVSPLASIGAWDGSFKIQRLRVITYPVSTS